MTRRISIRTANGRAHRSGLGDETVRRWVRKDARKRRNRSAIETIGSDAAEVRAMASTIAWIKRDYGTLPKWMTRAWRKSRQLARALRRVTP